MFNELRIGVVVVATFISIGGSLKSADGREVVFVHTYVQYRSRNR